MKRSVDRMYYLSRDEVRDAIWYWLKENDVPVPESSNTLNFVGDDIIPSAFTLNFTEDIKD